MVVIVTHRQGPNGKVSLELFRSAKALKPAVKTPPRYIDEHAAEKAGVRIANRLWRNDDNPEPSEDAASDD